jgi:photosystem II stability/assembly factor-like uncharacterized protein
VIAIVRRRGGGARAALAAFIVASLVVGNAAAATNTGPSQNGVAALAFNVVSHALIKADPHAVYVSHNEGQDWQPIALPTSVQRGRITSLAVAARSNDVLYIAGLGFGVLRSPDGGRTWTAKNEGLPSLDVTGFTSHADQPDTLYAYLSGHGIFRSDDAGNHWRLMDAGPREKIVEFVHSNMPGSMQTGWLLAATAKGVSRSMDCFCGWRDAGALGRHVTAVAYDPSAPKRVYAVTAEGLFVSADGGEQWSRAQSPGKLVTALVVSDRGIVYATARKGELFRSADHGTTWLRVDG